MAEVALDADDGRVVQHFRAVIDVGSSQHEQAAHLTRNADNVVRLSYTFSMKWSKTEPCCEHKMFVIAYIGRFNVEYKLQTMNPKSYHSKV